MKSNYFLWHSLVLWFTIKSILSDDTTTPEIGTTFNHSTTAEQTQMPNDTNTTPKTTVNEHDFYLSYSYGKVSFKLNGTQCLAMGLPLAANRLGKVEVLSWNTTSILNVTGEQIGSYFGYSLTAVDVDGNELVDLIIGSPLHTVGGKYEVGRIYILFQSANSKMQEISQIDGVNSRSRFGLALSSNDFNSDGFGDVAVAAPYDGSDGRGAVYIFHGSAKGLSEKYSQVIYAENAPDLFLTTFGSSVSGLILLDDNMVWTYDSNKMVVFRSHPLAVMQGRTGFLTDTQLFSLDKSCSLRNGSQVTCTRIISCLKYSGVNSPFSISFDVNWVLDGANQKPRMYFLNDEGQNIRNSTVTLYRNRPECRSEQVYIVDDTSDKATPLEFEMRFTLEKTEADIASLKQQRLLLDDEM